MVEDAAIRVHADHQAQIESRSTRQDLGLDHSQTLSAASMLVAHMSTP